MAAPPRRNKTAATAVGLSGKLPGRHRLKHPECPAAFLPAVFRALPRLSVISSVSPEISPEESGFVSQTGGVPPAESVIPPLHIASFVVHIDFPSGPT